MNRNEMIELLTSKLKNVIEEGKEDEAREKIISIVDIITED